MPTIMTLSLFPAADAATHDAEFRALFDAWIASRKHSTSKARSERALSARSALVYQEMWYAFAEYCAVRRLDLIDLDADDLQTFLVVRGTGATGDRPRVTTKGDELSARYAWRMLTLIDRVLRFHAQRQGMAPNGAARELLQRPEYRYAQASDRDPLPDYYPEALAKRLIAYLTALNDQAVPAGALTWKEVRDRTAVALMLGAGLAPGDVRVLTTDGVMVEGGRRAGVPWKLALPGNGNGPGREAPIAGWAGRQLAFWLAVRARQQVAGNLVFPSTLAGRAWSDTACYRACKAVLAGAGMDAEGGGVFKLRHTFALRQLAKGKSEAEVARWLGLLDINGMARYRRVVPRHVDVA
jgi:site-specific recombinase XerD